MGSLAVPAGTYNTEAVLFGEVSEDSMSKKINTPQNGPSAQQTAEEMIATFKVVLTPEQEAGLNEELAGLSYEEILARVAASMARNRKHP